MSAPPRSSWVALGALLLAMSGCGGGGGGSGTPPPPPAALTITTASLADGVHTQSYSFTLQASGGSGARTWSVASGSPPPGLTLNAGTGNLSGTPDVPAADTGAPVSFPLTVQVRDSSGATASRSFTLRVARPLEISTDVLGDASLEQNYSVNLTLVGGIGPWTFSLSSGSLPPGVSLSAAGLVQGTPTAQGLFGFTVRLRDTASPAQQTEKPLALVVQPASVRITTPFLPRATQGTGYSEFLGASGGTPPYAWSLLAGSLPNDLALDPSTGAISGTPSVAGSFPLTVRVADSAAPQGTATKDFTLDVGAAALGRNDAIANATPLGNGRFAASISPYADPPDSSNPDSDYYRVTANASAVVTVEIFARRLAAGSPLDAVIEIVDASGVPFTTCRDAGTVSGVTGDPDPTPLAFDDPCVNDDIDLGVNRDCRLEFQVPATGTTFFVRVLDWRGDARPDMIYEVAISGAN